MLHLQNRRILARPVLYGFVVAGHARRNTNELRLVRGLYAGYAGTADQGTNGYYWSSTASTAANAYNLSYNASNVYPSSSLTKALTMSLRCLAR